MKRFKRIRRKRNNRRRPINALASAFTTAGLYCGIASIFAGIEQEYAKAAYFILAAIVFDMLDGTAAKLTHTTSEFGKQLDSLSDCITFGAAPAVLIYNNFLIEENGTPVGRIGGIFAIIYVICTALRLARYNVYQADRRDYFTGLPSPAAAGTIASFVLFAFYFNYQVAFYLLGPMTLGLAFLMVSTVRYPKDAMKAMVLTPRRAFRFLIVLAVLLALFNFAREYHVSIVLFPLASLYVLYGIGDELYRWMTRKPLPPEPAAARDQTQEEVSSIESRVKTGDAL